MIASLFPASTAAEEVAHPIASSGWVRGDRGPAGGLILQRLRRGSDAVPGPLPA